MDVDDVDVFTVSNQDSYAGVGIEIAVQYLEVLDDGSVAFVMRYIILAGSSEKSVTAVRIIGLGLVQARNEFAVAVEGSTKTHYREPLLVRGERIGSVVDRDVGGELAAGAAFALCSVGATYDGCKSVKFAFGPDLVATVGLLGERRPLGIEFLVACCLVIYTLDSVCREVRVFEPADERISVPLRDGKRHQSLLYVSFGVGLVVNFRMPGEFGYLEVACVVGYFPAKGGVHVGAYVLPPYAAVGVVVQPLCD